MTMKPGARVGGNIVRPAHCAAIRAIGAVALALVSGACPTNPVNTIFTDVGLSVGTQVKTTGIIDVNNDCSHAVPPAPDIQAWWNNLPPINRTFPFVGFEIWRNTFDGCETTRLDVYHALVTFNMASVSNLKGLVKAATLKVNTRALPAGVGAGANCIAFTGGAGKLDRFGAATGPLPVTGGGTLSILQPSDPFSAGNSTVFTFENPWAKRDVFPGAASPTSTIASGTGGASYVVDVTSQVVAALNGGAAGMSWVLTSDMEGPLSAPSATSIDCKTSYAFGLTIEHY
jgi:hypothetical protein